MLLSNKLVIFGFVVLCTYLSTISAGQIVLGSPNLKPKPIAIERIQITDELRERAALEALQSINETAKMVIAAGGDESAAILCEEGFKIAFELLASCRKSLNDGFIIAHKLAAKDPETAVEKISAAVEKIIEYIFMASVPVQTVHGAALAKVGESARPGLRTAMELLHRCGVVLFETLNSAQRVAILGVKAGGDASDLALLAAHEIFNTAEEAIYKLLIDSAEVSFEALKSAAGKAPLKGFPERLDALITNETPEAKFAMDSLNIMFNKALKVLADQRQIEAVKVIYHSFLSSIFDNANAVVHAYRAIDDADKLLGPNPEIAVNALHKGMIAVENVILAVSADAILGLGAAGEICNEEIVDGLRPAVVSVVEGRDQLSTDVDLAEKVAILGLRAGGVAARQSLKAARKSIAAASNNLFTHFIDGAQIAFNAFYRTL